ncbi:MAG TPA: hypothetical protein VGR08_05100, partial [Thermomicrobiales bacterium]|nr:hypothetical protein [Thermomicrobiales bacterium]
MTTDVSEDDQAGGERRTLTPGEALDILMEGNRRYLDENIAPRDYSASGIAQVREHAPIAAILGCGDARIGAELIFDRGPG